LGFGRFWFLGRTIEIKTQGEVKMKKLLSLVLLAVFASISAGSAMAQNNHHHKHHKTWHKHHKTWHKHHKHNNNKHNH